MYLISGCLLGINCKYNGGNNLNTDVADFAAGKSYCLVCPEEFRGCRHQDPLQNTGETEL